MGDASKLTKMRAAVALDSLLRQVSGINVKDVGFRSADLAVDIDILAHVAVFGHSYTLACKVEDSVAPDLVWTAFEELQKVGAYLPGSVIPVIIVPYLSADALAQCEKHRTGCLDLEGNGRIVMREVFISMEDGHLHKSYKLLKSNLW